MPSPQFQQALAQLGIPAAWHSRERLIELIRESMDGWGNHDSRSTNALAQIVLTLVRMRQLRVPATGFVRTGTNE